MKQRFFAAIALVIVLAIIGYGLSTTALQERLAVLVGRGSATSRTSLAAVSFPEVTVKAEVAATDKARRSGLSDRESLSETAGMLFIFDKPGPYAFSMNGMRFPLDFIWMYNGRIVDITQNVPVPIGVSPVIQPNSFVTHVLEVNAGFVARHNVTIDDLVEITQIW